MLEEGKTLWRSGLMDGGLVTLIPAHKIPAKCSPNAANFDVTAVGMLRKRLGYERFTGSAKTTPTGTKVSGLYATTLSSTVYVLAAEGTVLHNITAGDWNTTIGGVTITTDTYVCMKTFNNLVLIVNPGGGPYKWTGSGNATALGGSPPANAIGVEIHRNRAWMWNGTSTLYWSALGNPEDWTSADNAGSMTINTGDGGVINGMVSCGDFALISKATPASGGTEGALYILYGSSPFDFMVHRVANVAAVSPYAMISYDDWGIVPTSRGIYGIQGRRMFKLSEAIQPTYDAISDKSTLATGRYKNTVRFSHKGAESSSYNDRELILNVERGVWGYNHKTISLYTNHPNGNLLIGSSTPTILVWTDETGNSDDGSAINFYWETPDLVFDIPEAGKRLSTSHLHCQNTGDHTITLTHSINGTDTGYYETMNVQSEGPVKRFTHLNKTGKIHRLRLTNNTSTDRVVIYDLEVFAQVFEPGIG